jgi:hypothetical protein
MRIPAFLGVGAQRRRANLAALAACAFLGCASDALAAAPVNSVLKIANGANSASVDNGWVISKPPTVAPQLRRVVQDVSGAFTAFPVLKLKTGIFGMNNAGLIFDTGGVTFAPCPAAPTPSRCAASNFGSEGVGIGFGELSFGGVGGSSGGWVSDATFKATGTNVDQNMGALGGVAADPTNGAYAVGRDYNTSTNTIHAIVLELDEAGHTYKALSRQDLGTLGGPTSNALGISKNALYVVGSADDASGTMHAAYAATNGTSWTDVTGGFPSDVIQSKAVAVSNAGIIVGTATVRRVVGGQNKSVNIGFTYNIGTAETKFFEQSGWNVVPVNVIDNGHVVGTLTQVGAGSSKLAHPFFYNGTILHDYGVVNMGASPAYGCRVNSANNLGEIVGGCIADSSATYGPSGASFFIDTEAASPALVDLNATLHANANSTNTAIRGYLFGTATGIDDQHEIVLNAVKSTGVTAIFIASKQAYNP